MAKNLVIVESPAKAKTIEGFLGEDFMVKSSYGHVRDLSSSGLSVDVEKDFVPQYEISPDKKKIVSELKKLAKEAELVWLATDEDREGEAISWHLYEALDLKENKTRRIVFNEITKNAITNAIDNPRLIDLKLVNAQQARRVLDRLVGYELSPVLWKKVRPSLSAGRVQSVAVRLIVEREKEIEAFVPESAYKITAFFHLQGNEGGPVIKAELPKRFKQLEEARAFMQICSNADYSISNIETKPAKKSAAAPFTTSTLQQEASRKLGFSVSRTMMIAQRLYESGRITYMRTDSVNLSNDAITAAEAEIKKAYGEDYAESRQYKTKAKGAQEAHEAIRPTNFENHTIDGEAAEQKLYELIWKRTVASQMSDAQLEKTTATISISGSEENFVAKGEVLKFEGFLKVYLESTDDENEEVADGVLPPMKIGDVMLLDHAEGRERFTHHPPRFTEASLVKKMEELGIGRPSTYAPTISTIQKRGYVEKEEREGKERQYNILTAKQGSVTEEVATEITGAEKNKLFPSDTGIVVNDFLVQNFGDILDYNFTATVEKEFDEIAEGQKEWNKMIDQFYHPFHESVENTLEHSEKAKGERLLGNDPVSGLPVYVKIGKYGAIAQMGETESEDKPRFAGLRKDQSLSTITFEEALELFKLPRTVGTFEDEEIVAAIGRYGPYLRHKGAFFSLGEDHDPHTVEEDVAIVIIKEKREADKKKTIKTFEENEDVQVLNGRYGPYIKIGKKNYRIPKGTVPEELTLEKCLEIAEESDQRKAKKKEKGK